MLHVGKGLTTLICLKSNVILPQNHHLAYVNIKYIPFQLQTLTLETDSSLKEMKET